MEATEHINSLSEAPVSPAARRAMLVVIAVNAAGFCAMAPFAGKHLVAIPAYIPAIQGMTWLIDLVTAVLLLIEARRTRSAAVIMLGAGYLFSGAMAVIHALSFPGVFAPGGAIGGTYQTTPWLYNFWHVGILLAALAYAALRARGYAVADGRRAVIVAWAAAGLAVIGCTLLATVGVSLLPAVLDGDHYTSLIHLPNVTVGVIALAAFANQWRHRSRSALDCWLVAVLWALFLEIALAAVFNAGRYDVGWYGGRVFNLVSTSFLLVLLLTEVAALHGRLEDALTTAERTNQELVESRELLVRGQRLEAMGQLTSGIAHDFNNLLAAAQGNLELAKLENPPDRIGTFIDRSIAALQRGSALTAQLVAFARGQQLALVATPVNELITELRDLLERSAGPTISLRLRLDPGTGAALVDRVQLEVSLINLAVNARDAMSSRGHIEISTRRITDNSEIPNDLDPGEYVAIDVTDTGPGMAPDVLAHAFEPFFTTKRRGEGSGLGLAQVYGIARQSGGTALIESPPGKGTTVSILLRRAPTESMKATPPIGSRAPRIAPLRIALVDDDAAVRPAVVQMLRSMGHAVEEFDNGTDALSRLQAMPFDLLVCDYAMPGMTGDEVARRAREIAPGLAVLLITGFSKPGLADSWPTLAKPFRLAELEEAVGRLCGDKRHLRLVSETGSRANAS